MGTGSPAAGRAWARGGGREDLGLIGPCDSIIGVEKDAVLHRFLTGMPSRFETAKGDPRFAAVVVDVDEQTGRARSIDRMLLAEKDVLAL